MEHTPFLHLPQQAPQPSRGTLRLPRVVALELLVPVLGVRRHQGMELQSILAEMAALTEAQPIEEAPAEVVLADMLVMEGLGETQVLQVALAVAVQGD